MSVSFLKPHKYYLPTLTSALLLLVCLTTFLLNANLPLLWSVLALSAVSCFSLLSVIFYTVWQRRTQHHDLLAIDKHVSALEQKFAITADPSQTLVLRLQHLQAKALQLQKQDAEVRHLVRVQGLIDHELAIGNRVFFESKLQHYLGDSSEFAFGAIYIIQLSHPEIGRAGIKQLQRLRSCVDILHALAADYTETVLARLSENDLVFMVCGLNHRDIDKLGDRMATLLSRAACFVESNELDVLHIGYAPYKRGQSSYQILSEADMALRTAQLQGPNAAHGFLPQQDKSLARGSVWWRSELNRALQENRFSLSFQPVFSWQDGDVLQHEVLIRLQSSDGQQVPAAVFLPMAFNCGLAGQIDQHVLLKTARLCAADYRHQSRCSVNVSVHALLDEQWWQWLEQTLMSGQLDAHQFALELAEHHLIKHFKQLRAKLLQLHQAGFALIVDQVGLVIDNAIYADELPLESVKLHPSVVRNIDQHLEQQLFVRGLIAGYAGKGIRVIACGVELEAEWFALQKLGIAGGQGFYFSQPLNQIIAQGQLQ